MPYAIALCLDDPAPVQALLDRLGGLADAVRALGYRPHVTLGLYDDGADEAALHRTLARLAGPIDLEIAALGIFPPGVLYAAPCPTPALLALHARCASPHPHFRPGGWMPHITLAASAGAEGAAMLAADWAPFRALCSTVELVRFPPVDVLASRRLA